MRIAFLADIHSNYAALEAVISDMKDRMIYQTVFLGDYILGPVGSNKTVEMIRNYEMNYPNTLVISGNIDEIHQMIEAGDSSVYPELLDSYGTLNDENKAYIKSLRKTANIHFGYELIRIIHNPSDDFVFHMDDLIKRENNQPNMEILHDLSNLYKENMIVFGHYHIQMVQKVNNKRFVCPGSVGMPFNGNPQAQYMIYETESGALSTVSVTYDMNVLFDDPEWKSFESKYADTADKYRKTLISGHHYL